MSVLSSPARGAAVILAALAAVTLTACGQDAAAPAPETPAPEVASPEPAQPAIPQGATEYAAALEPNALMLESLGCYRAINFASVESVRERLSPDLNDSLANTPKTRFLTLTTTAMRLNIRGPEQQAAHNAGRTAPLKSEPIPADYEEYLRRCQAVLARAVTLEVD